MSRKPQPRTESTLLIAEAGAPWVEHLERLMRSSGRVDTLIQAPTDSPAQFQKRLEAKLAELEAPPPSAAVLVAAPVPTGLFGCSSLLGAVIGKLNGAARVILCPGADLSAAAARELVALAATMRELVRGTSIRFALAGHSGEALERRSG